MTTPKTKVIHTLSKDKNGDSAITSKTVSKPKDNHKTKDAKPPAPVKSDLTDDQLKVLRALNKLDKDHKGIGSMVIAVECGFDKDSQAPRGRVRTAMKRLHTLHFVSIHKEGVKYSFSMTPAGIERLLKPANPSKTETKAHASNPTNTVSHGSTQPPAVLCPLCKTENPSAAEFCKACGGTLKTTQTAVSPVAA